MFYGNELFGVPDTYIGGERPVQDVRKIAENRGRRPVNPNMLDKRRHSHHSNAQFQDRAQDLIPSHDDRYDSKHRPPTRPKTFAGHLQMVPAYAKSIKYDLEPSHLEMQSFDRMDPSHLEMQSFDRTDKSTEFKIEQFIKYSYFPEPSRFERRTITHTPPPDYELNLAGVDIPPPDYDEMYPPRIPWRNRNFYH